jgi:uncharacterized membrane protein
MSNLVVVGFLNAQETEEVRRELVTIQQEHLIALASPCAPCPVDPYQPQPYR